MFRPSIAGMLALASLGSALGQPSRETLQLNSVRLYTSLAVEIRLFSAAQDMVVPYCGEGEGGSLTLCNLAVRLERETRNGWRRVGLRHADAVLGGVPAEKWRFRLIAAGRWHDFHFLFPKDDFAVERGQRLRVVVDTWSGEPSMRSGQPPLRVASAIFTCP